MITPPAPGLEVGEARSRRTVLPRRFGGALAVRRTTGMRALALAAVAMSAGGCAERGLVTRPDRAPGPGTWTAVWVAGTVAALVVGVLLTLPALRERGGARLAAAILSVQTGTVVVAGTVLTAVGVRSWQLMDRPLDAEPAAALVRLSRVDGDTAFLALMVIVTVATCGLVATITALAARFAAGTDVLERSVACTVLGVELAGSGYAIARLALGDRGWPYLGSGLAFPVLVAALVSCWPRPTRTVPPA